jgi:hypothetical protein
MKLTEHRASNKEEKNAYKIVDGKQEKRRPLESRRKK